MGQEGSSVFTYLCHGLMKWRLSISVLQRPSSSMSDPENPDLESIGSIGAPHTTSLFMNWVAIVNRQRLAASEIADLFPLPYSFLKFPLQGATVACKTQIKKLL